MTMTSKYFDNTDKWFEKSKERSTRKFEVIRDKDSYEDDILKDFCDKHKISPSHVKVYKDLEYKRTVFDEKLLTMDLEADLAYLKSRKGKNHFITHINNHMRFLSGGFLYHKFSSIYEYHGINRIKDNKYQVCDTYIRSSWYYSKRRDHNYDYYIMLATEPTVIDCFWNGNPYDFYEYYVNLIEKCVKHPTEKNFDRIKEIFLGISNFDYKIETKLTTFVKNALDKKIYDKEILDLNDSTCTNEELFLKIRRARDVVDKPGFMINKEVHANRKKSGVHSITRFVYDVDIHPDESITDKEKIEKEIIKGKKKTIKTLKKLEEKYGLHVAEINESRHGIHFIIYLDNEYVVKDEYSKGDDTVRESAHYMEGLFFSLAVSLSYHVDVDITAVNSLARLDREFYGIYDKENADVRKMGRAIEIHDIREEPQYMMSPAQIIDSCKMMCYKHDSFTRKILFKLEDHSIQEFEVKGYRNIIATNIHNCADIAIVNSFCDALIEYHEKRDDYSTAKARYYVYHHKNLEQIRAEALNGRYLNSGKFIAGILNMELKSEHKVILNKFRRKTMKGNSGKTKQLPEGDLTPEGAMLLFSLNGLYASKLTNILTRLFYNQNLVFYYGKLNENDMKKINYFDNIINSLKEEGRSDKYAYMDLANVLQIHEDIVVANIHTNYQNMVCQGNACYGVTLMREFVSMNSGKFGNLYRKNPSDKFIRYLYTLPQRLGIFSIGIADHNELGIPKWNGSPNHTIASVAFNYDFDVLQLKKDIHDLFDDKEITRNNHPFNTPFSIYQLRHRGKLGQLMVQRRNCIHVDNNNKGHYIASKDTMDVCDLRYDKNGQNKSEQIIQSAARSMCYHIKEQYRGKIYSAYTRGDYDNVVKYTKEMYQLMDDIAGKMFVIYNKQCKCLSQNANGMFFKGFSLNKYQFLTYLETFKQNVLYDVLDEASIKAEVYEDPVTYNQKYYNYKYEYYYTKSVQEKAKQLLDHADDITYKDIKELGVMDKSLYQCCKRKAKSFDYSFIAKQMPEKTSKEIKEETRKEIQANISALMSVYRVKNVFDIKKLDEKKMRDFTDICKLIDRKLAKEAKKCGTKN